MLQTNLNHIESENKFQQVLSDNENVMLCCGRMGPMCIPVYAAMKELEKTYDHISFWDMEFDIPVSQLIRKLPECNGFHVLPFVVYFNEGKVVTATSGIQTKDEIIDIIKKEFPN